MNRSRPTEALRLTGSLHGNRTIGFVYVRVFVYRILCNTARCVLIDAAASLALSPSSCACLFLRVCLAPTLVGFVGLSFISIQNRVPCLQSHQNAHSHGAIVIQLDDDDDDDARAWLCKLWGCCTEPRALLARRHCHCSKEFLTEPGWQRSGVVAVARQGVAISIIWLICY